MRLNNEYCGEPPAQCAEIRGLSAIESCRDQLHLAVVGVAAQIHFHGDRFFTKRNVLLVCGGNCLGNVAAADYFARRLIDAGHVAYFAGGCVRDKLLGLNPKDYDIAT